MFATARKLKTLIIGADTGTTGITSDGVITELKAASIPISSADCRTCPDPCDEGHEEYPKKFDVDMESYMLGSVKPYRRQVIISTGKIDWPKEVTEASGSLAAFLLEAQPEKKHSSPLTLPESTDTPATPKAIGGVFRSSDCTRLAILNGSHTTLSTEETLETVLIFPDYKVVAEVPRSLDGAKALWTSVLDISEQPSEETLFKTWVLPYSCVILLCSHKKRDNRCSIAAPKLEQAFVQSLEAHKWEVHTQLEALPCTVGPSLETIAGTHKERAEHAARQLRGLHSLQKALILKNSHTGGHKFAGNCIIYTPQGSGVWYGRVTTHEVESIVQNTIIGGEVLAPLLRGGVNLSRPGCASLNDW